MNINCSSLSEVRENIDRIDREIVAMIVKRGAFVAKTASFKKTTEKVKASNRVEQIISKVTSLVLEQGANPEVVESIYRSMISAFIDMELKGHSLLNEK